MDNNVYIVKADDYLNSAWYYDVFIAPQRDRDEFFSYIKKEEMEKDD